MIDTWLWLTKCIVLRGGTFLPPLALAMVLPASTRDPLHHTAHIIPCIVFLWVYYKLTSSLWNVGTCVDNSILWWLHIQIHRARIGVVGWTLHLLHVELHLDGPLRIFSDYGPGDVVQFLGFRVIRWGKLDPKRTQTSCCSFVIDWNSCFSWWGLKVPCVFLLDCPSADLITVIRWSQPTQLNANSSSSALSHYTNHNHHLL